MKVKVQLVIGGILVVSSILVTNLILTANTDVSAPLISFSSRKIEGWKDFLAPQSNLYALQYPSDWTVIDNPPYDLSLSSAEGERINIFVQRNEKNLSLKEWLKSEFPSTFVESFSPASIDKLPAQYSSANKILYAQLSNGKILSIIYINSEGDDASPGILHDKEFVDLIRTITVQ